MTKTEFMRSFETKTKYKCPRHKFGEETYTVEKVTQLNTIQ